MPASAALVIGAVQIAFADLAHDDGASTAARACAARVCAARRAASDPATGAASFGNTRAEAGSGHAEAAAGVAGVIKAMLALRHGEIPASLHFSTPSPHVPWSSLCVKVADRRVPLPDRGRRRLAGVSSFGFSGTNAHIVVSAYESPQVSAASALGSEAEPSTSSAEAQVSVLALSAKTERSLRSLAGKYAAHVERHSEQSLADICHSAAQHRSEYEQRLAVVSGGRQELIERLQAFAEGRTADEVRKLLGK